MPAISERASDQIAGWLRVPMRAREYRVLICLWQSLPRGLQYHVPRDIEVYLTVREIAERLGCSIATVRHALRGLEHDVGAVYRTRSLRDHRRWCLWLAPCPVPVARVHSAACIQSEIESLAISNACDEGGRFPSGR